MMTHAERLPVEKFESGWLIEQPRYSSVKGSIAPFFVSFHHGYILFTEDSKEALRFSRKQDAESFIKVLGHSFDDLTVTQHQWGS